MVSGLASTRPTTHITLSALRITAHEHLLRLLVCTLGIDESRAYGFPKAAHEFFEDHGSGDCTSHITASKCHVGLLDLKLRIFNGSEYLTRQVHAIEATGESLQAKGSP